MPSMSMMHDIHCNMLYFLSSISLDKNTIKSILCWLITKNSPALTCSSMTIVSVFVTAKSKAFTKKPQRTGLRNGHFRYMHFETEQTMTSLQASVKHAIKAGLILWSLLYILTSKLEETEKHTDPINPKMYFILEKMCFFYYTDIRGILILSRFDSFTSVFGGTDETLFGGLR